MNPKPYHKVHGKEVIDAKREKAKMLLDLGYSFRQIAKELGYKSTASVTHLLKVADK